VVYFSKTIALVECNYAIYNKKLLAIRVLGLGFRVLGLGFRV